MTSKYSLSRRLLSSLKYTYRYQQERNSADNNYPTSHLPQPISWSFAAFRHLLTDGLALSWIARFQVNYIRESTDCDGGAETAEYQEVRGLVIDRDRNNHHLGHRGL